MGSERQAPYRDFTETAQSAGSQRTSGTHIKGNSRTRPGTEMETDKPGRLGSSGQGSVWKCVEILYNTIRSRRVYIQSVCGLRESQAGMAFMSSKSSSRQRLLLPQSYICPLIFVEPSMRVPAVV